MVSPRVVTKKRVNDDLRKLERYWVASTQGQLGQNGHEQNNSVEVLEFNSRYAEVEHVATAIRQMMTKDDRLNFSDFSVLTRHLSDYDTIIKPIFDQFDIPIFPVERVGMYHHHNGHKPQLLYQPVFFSARTARLIFPASLCAGTIAVTYIIFHFSPK
ncbi:exodeoxyribonuclease V subunit gamma [Pediococcus acidilactici]